MHEFAYVCVSFVCGQRKKLLGKKGVQRDGEKGLWSSLAVITSMDTNDNEKREGKRQRPRNRDAEGQRNKGTHIKSIVGDIKVGELIHRGDHNAVILGNRRRESEEEKEKQKQREILYRQRIKARERGRRKRKRGRYR